MLSGMKVFGTLVILTPLEMKTESPYDELASELHPQHYRIGGKGVIVGIGEMIRDLSAEVGDIVYYRSEFATQITEEFPEIVVPVEALICPRKTLEECKHLAIKT